MLSIGRQFFMLLDKAGKDSPFPPRHAAYWNTSEHYLMGNVTPGDMRAIIQVRAPPCMLVVCA
jgi:hypothetical protein